MAYRSPIPAFCLLIAGLAAPASAQNGIGAVWDVSKMSDAVAAHAKRLTELLDKLTPQEWVRKGAPKTYVEQWNAGRSRTLDLVRASQALSQDPERLTYALEAFFRLQALDGVLNSVADAVHTYQNPALAELMRGIMAENDINAARLREHMVDLAKAKELEFKVVDQEAQRCRGFLSKQPNEAEKARAAGAKK